MLANEQIVIRCRTQLEPVDVIDCCNVMGIGWVDGEPAVYFAPTFTSEPYSIVLNNGAIGYCRFKDVDGLVAQGYTEMLPQDFINACNRMVADGYRAPDEYRAPGLFDASNDRTPDLCL